MLLRLLGCFLAVHSASFAEKEELTFWSGVSKVLPACIALVGRNVRRLEAIPAKTNALVAWGVKGVGRGAAGISSYGNKWFGGAIPVLERVAAGLNRTAVSPQAPETLLAGCNQAVQAQAKAGIAVLEEGASGLQGLASMVPGALEGLGALSNRVTSEVVKAARTLLEDGAALANQGTQVLGACALEEPACMSQLVVLSITGAETFAGLLNRGTAGVAEVTLKLLPLPGLVVSHIACFMNESTAVVASAGCLLTENAAALSHQATGHLVVFSESSLAQLNCVLPALLSVGEGSMAFLNQTAAVTSDLAFQAPGAAVINQIAAGTPSVVEGVAGCINCGVSVMVAPALGLGEGTSVGCNRFFFYTVGAIEQCAATVNQITGDSASFLQELGLQANRCVSNCSATGNEVVAGITEVLSIGMEGASSSANQLCASFPEFYGDVQHHRNQLRSQYPSANGCTVYFHAVLKRCMKE